MDPVVHRPGEGETHRLGGSAVTIKAAGDHTGGTFFSNRGNTPVRFLNFNTPSGWEGYMRDLGRELGGNRRPISQEIGRIASRYDFHPVA